MSQGCTGRAPVAYLVRVNEQLDDHWAAWFGPLTLAHDKDGATSISGLVADQAELHGLLMKVRDLGVTLLSVELIDAPSARPDLPAAIIGDPSATDDEPERP